MYAELGRELIAKALRKAGEAKEGTIDSELLRVAARLIEAGDPDLFAMQEEFEKSWTPRRVGSGSLVLRPATDQDAPYCQPAETAPILNDWVKQYCRANRACRWEPALFSTLHSFILADCRAKEKIPPGLPSPFGDKEK